jgi:PAS domain S-box-containing protein
MSLRLAVYVALTNPVRELDFVFSESKLSPRCFADLNLMPAAKPRIQILHLEDNPIDAELIHELLAVDGLASDFMRVAGRKDFEAALSAGTFDAVLADYNVPDYDGKAALKFAKQQQPAVPVIVISGSLGDEAAVQCLKQGATDYLLKDRLDRLGPALRRALREAAEERERRRAEAELRESEERFRQLAETIDDVFWTTAPDHKAFIYVSPAFERVWGRSLAELHSTPILWIDAIHPGDRSRVLEALQRLAAGVDYNIEYQIIRPDGGTRWILDRAFAVRNDTGGIYRTVGVARDITQQKFADDLQLRSDERLAAIFSASPVAIAFGTLEGRIIEVNPEGCRIFGYDRDEIVGRTTVELSLWAEPGARKVAIEKLAAEKRLRNYEAKFRRKSGEIRSVILSMEILPLGDEPTVLTMCIDVTDKNAIKAQLHRVQRVESIGLLASGIAHDMNNILAPILMGAPLLRMGLAPAEMETVLSTVEVSAQRGAALVRQLLIFGRGVEGEMEPVSITAILAEITKISRQTFSRKISIVSHVPDDVWPVHGDATQLHQIVLNLCVNARDALLEGGTLTLAAENVAIDEHYSALHTDAKPGRYVLIKVIDDGIGIPPEIAEKIFDPFFTTKDAGKGTGLGLSTVLGIVKSHGGFTRLHSAPGRGSTFEIFLPVSADRKRTSPAENVISKSVRGAGELIIVVDDEQNVRALLRKTLVQNNYKVMTAQDGVEATAVFAANPEARLIITDLDMPLMDGINLGRVLRRMNPAVKIVISTGLTGRSGADKRQADIDALGVSAVLTKPYTGAKLLRAVYSALAEKAPGSETGLTHTAC